MNIPNTLTLLRLALIPIFVALFYLPAPLTTYLAALVFVAAAVTDWLDGYLARRLGQVSKLGAFLDPVADKIMVAVVLIVLLQREPTVIMALPVAVIVGREIAISALREWMAELGMRNHVAVSWIGKAKTACQMTAIVLLILAQAGTGISLHSFGMLCLYVATALTLWSMGSYLRAAWPELTSD